MPEHIINKFWECFVATIAIGILTLIIYIVGSVAAADGKTDYCYIRTSTTSSHEPQIIPVKYHLLYAHRPWRHDEEIARTTGDIQEMFDVAAAMNCEVK